MKDFLGQQLEIGDVVIHICTGSSTNWFEVSVVEKFTPQNVKVKGSGAKSPLKMCKIDPELATMYFLKKGGQK